VLSAGSPCLSVSVRHLEADNNLSNFFPVGHPVSFPYISCQYFISVNGSNGFLSSIDSKEGNYSINVKLKPKQRGTTYRGRKQKRSLQSILKTS
jgi:hypothetical protein